MPSSNKRFHNKSRILCSLFFVHFLPQARALIIQNTQPINKCMADYLEASMLKDLEAVACSRSFNIDASICDALVDGLRVLNDERTHLRQDRRLVVELFIC